jgi:glycogen synthase
MKYFGMDNLKDDIPLFSFIGRVTKQKGVHLIIDAV